MKRALVVVPAVLIALFAFMVGVARAGSTTLSGTISTSSPTHNPGMETGCTSLGGKWAYNTHAFTVTASGSYTFKEAGTPLDAFIGLYGPSFNPALVSGTGSNCIASDRTTFTVSLSTGVHYILVVEPIHLGGAGAYSVSVSGPGDLSLEAGSSGATVVSHLSPYGCSRDCPEINIPLGYHLAGLFPGIDTKGRAALDVYCINVNGGTLGGQVTQDEITQFPAIPQTPTLVKNIDTCSVPVAFYILTSGEYQVNIAIPYQGKVIAIIFTGLPPENIHHYIVESLPIQ